MKTKPSLKIFKLSTLASLGIAITVALLTVSASAQTRVEITVTENSPTSLSVSVPGFTGIQITNTSPDHWNVSLPFLIQNNFPVNEWGESPTTSNQVTFAGNGFTVLSDGLSGVSADGIFPNGGTFAIGTLSDGNTGVDMTFNDNADSKEGHGVPDTGSTLGLLAFALAALFSASCLRHIQLT